MLWLICLTIPDSNEIVSKRLIDLDDLHILENRYKFHSVAVSFADKILLVFACLCHLT